MANKTVQPIKGVSGTVEIPGDKSISHRSVILGALSDRVCEVENFLLGEDCLRTMEAFRAMGIAIERQGKQLTIHGQGLQGLKAPAQPIDCGNSGTTTRLMMGVFTGQPFNVELFGDASLSKRPMERVITPLSKMGLETQANGAHPGKLPLRVHGTSKVRALNWQSPVASAQVKSAILLAGLYADGITEVSEPSRSRDHTERMLEASGVSLERSATTVRLKGPALLQASRFQVPGDISSAAFVIALALLSGRGETVVRGVGVNPTRTGFLDIIRAMGAHVSYRNEKTSGGEPIADIVVEKSVLHSTEVKGDVLPRAIDEMPILAILATQAKGKTFIRDAQELRVKESDRIATLAEELTKMGAQIEELPDGLIIQGPSPLRGAQVRSHGDHRLAMSLAVAATIAEGETCIEDVGCIDTSFPTFWEIFERLCGH